MSDRFEATLDSHLAGIFEQKLYGVLGAEGFLETLRLAGPHVTEFQRDSDLITLQMGQRGGQRQLVVVESETVDVDPLVGAAAKKVIEEIADQLLGSLPGVDHTALSQRIRSCLADLPA